MSDLQWNRPEWWPVLLALPLLAAALWYGFRALQRQSARWGAERQGQPASPWLRAGLLTAAVAFLLLSWIEPLYGEEKLQVERRGLDVIFCLDTSRSMLARDAQPDRIRRAQRDIRSMLPELVGGDRVGLVAFAGRAKLVVPLTHDVDSFRYLLDEVDTDAVRLGGSDLAAALRKGLELIDEDQEQTTVMVLLTDGEDLTGAGRQAAREVADRGVVLHTLGYGSPLGSKITVGAGDEESFLTDDEGVEVVSAMDADSLRRMSAVAGGEFLRAEQMALPLVELKRMRMDPMVKRSYDAGQETVLQSRFQWVLLPGVLFLLIDLFLRGGRRP